MLEKIGVDRHCEGAALHLYEEKTPQIAFFSG
jgi:hypothetical protein